MVNFVNLADIMGRVDQAKSNDQRMKMNQLLMQRQNRQFEREDAEIAQNNALKAAYKASLGEDGTFDKNVLLKGVGAVAPMKAYDLSQNIAKQGREEEMYGLEKQDIKLSLGEKKVSMARDALASATPETYGSIIQSLMQDPVTAKGIEGAPAEYSAEWIATSIQDADSALLNARQKAQQEFTASQNDQTRALTMRGQDMTARNAAANRAVSIRGQDLAHQRATEPTAADKKAALAMDSAAKKHKASQESALAKGQVIVNKVNEAKKAINFFTTGITGAVASRIPASDRKALESALETIKANLGFQELQEMRANSPTGGALGQVAVQELVALQSTVANLSPDLPPKVLAKNLDEVSAKYTRIMGAIKADLGLSDTGGSTGGWSIKRKN